MRLSEPMSIRLSRILKNWMFSMFIANAGMTISKVITEQNIEKYRKQMTPITEQLHTDALISWC